MVPHVLCGILHRRTWTFAAATSVLLLVGCSESATQGYQSFKEKQEAGYVPPESFSSDDEPAEESELLLAEFVPEPAASDDVPDQPISALAPVNVVDGSNVAALLRVGQAAPPPDRGAASSNDNSSASSASSAQNPNQTASAGPRPIQLLIQHQEFRPEGPEGALRVSYDDLDLLRVLNMDPVPIDAVDYFPDWLSALDGQRIRIRGYMMPTFESTGLERFVMARDTGLCCFGRNPKVYDLIAVELKPDKPTDYIHLRPFDVIGTLKIELVADGDKPLGLYWIEDAEVVQK